MPPIPLVPPPPVALVAPVQSSARGPRRERLAKDHDRREVLAELDDQEVRLGQKFGKVHGVKPAGPTPEVEPPPQLERPPSPLRVYDYGKITVTKDDKPQRAFTPSGGGRGYGFSVLDPIFLPLGQQRPRTSEGYRPPVPVPLTSQARPPSSARCHSARSYRAPSPRGAPPRAPSPRTVASSPRSPRRSGTYLDKLFSDVRGDMQAERCDRSERLARSRAQMRAAFVAKQEASRAAARARGEYHAVVAPPAPQVAPRPPTLGEYWRNAHVFADDVGEAPADCERDVARFEANFHDILLEARATAKLAS